MNKAAHIRKSIRFSRWSRKGYAAFNSLHGEVVIAGVNGEISSTLAPKSKKSHKNMAFITLLEERIAGGGSITEEEALALAALPNKEEFYAAADRIRRRFHGEKLDLCSIVNARSGRCSEDCKWCSQSAHHTSQIDIYELIPHEAALSQALANEAAGVKKFSLVTSGRTISGKNLEQLCTIYDDLRKGSSLELCASMGLLTRDQLQKLYDSGVRNYHCNIETAPSFFPTLCTTHTTQDKIDTLRAARAVGMRLCSGGIIGMGETMAHRVEMAFALRQLEVESIPLNILNPIKGTRLENVPAMEDEEVLTTIALFRFINPRAWIRFAGGRTMILHLAQRALKAGINGALVGDLLTTVGVGMEEDIENFRKAGFEC